MRTRIPHAPRRRLGLLLVALALAGGCLTPRPPTRYARASRIGVALLRDDVFRKEAHAVPDAVGARVASALGARNLAPVLLAPAAYVAELGRVRDTRRRLEALAGRAGAVDALLLVETRVRFYSQLSGVYRWTVGVKLSVAAPGALDRVTTDELELAAVLRHEHEREPEALAAVAEEIARRAGLAVDEFLASGEALAPPPAAAADDSVYFVLVDRFANGDPANDGPGTDPGDPAAWHGGDLAGVLGRLDYLQALGVRTIWLSPVFRARAADFMGHGAFHGYWVEDLREVDPRFGTEADLRALADALHARGMRLLLDLVVNHVGYEAPLVREHPDWFHPPGTIEDWSDPAQLTDREVHGLPDLAQERPEVRAYLEDASRGWLERARVDGFRLDAVKHVPLDFWRRFNGALAAARPGLVLLGELFEGAPDVVERVARQGGFTHLFDFPSAFALRDVFCGGRPAGRLGAVLSTRRRFPREVTLVTFLDNHDLPRVRTACGGDAARVREALTAQFAIDGVPALTYGTEIGLQGGEEPANRGDMVFDVEASADPAAAALREHVARLLALRARHSALAVGALRVAGLDGGVLTFVRVQGDELVLVAVNGERAPRPVPLPAALAGSDLRDLLSDEPVAGTPEVSPGATRVLAARAPRPGAFAALASPSSARRAVELRVAAGAGPAPAPGDTLLVVGSGPELGDWSPAGGVVLARAAADAGGGHRGTVELPVGEIFAFKLVARAPDGSVRWEPGEDRYLFVADGTDPLALDLTARREG